MEMVILQKKLKSSPSSSDEPEAETEIVSFIWIFGLEGGILATGEFPLEATGSLLSSSSSSLRTKV